MPGSLSIAICSSSAPGGIGKSWLAEAFAERACRSGYTAYCARAPRLFRELHVARGEGSYLRVLARLAKIDLVAIDDLGLAPLISAERHDLLELLEDRTERASTLITSQIPVKSWHDVIGEPTLADAICDRLVHSASVINLGGPSMRDPSTRGRGAPTPPSAAAPTEASEPPPKPSGSRGPPTQKTPSRICSRTGDLRWGRYPDTPPNQSRRHLSERGAEETIAHVAPLRRVITIGGMTDHDPPD